MHHALGMLCQCATHAFHVGPHRDGYNVFFFLIYGLGIFSSKHDSMLNCSFNFKGAKK